MLKPLVSEKTNTVPVEILEGEYNTWLHVPTAVHKELVFPVIENVLTEVENE